MLREVPRHEKYHIGEDANCLRLFCWEEKILHYIHAAAHFLEERGAKKRKNNIFSIVSTHKKGTPALTSNAGVL